MAAVRGCAAALAAPGVLLGALMTFPVCPRAAAAQGPPAARVEARSADILAVGIVRDGVMSVHLSRLLDNAPLHDAALTITLRGAAHPAVAEADGSYSVQAPELSLPGSASVVFEVLEGANRERLSGTLQIPAGGGGGEGPSNAARQYGWWALNFAVCIGFLYLWSRRGKSAD
jgi:hypothetical protein